MNARKKIFGFILVTVLFVGSLGFMGCENAFGENEDLDALNRGRPIIGKVIITDIPSEYFGLWITFHAATDFQNEWGSAEDVIEDKIIFAKINKSSVTVTLRDMSYGSNMDVNGTYGIGVKGAAGVAIRPKESGSYNDIKISGFFKEVTFNNGNATVSCNDVYLWE